MTSGMYDIAIVGAGMAGASLAAALQRSQRVLLLEREHHPGYHSTGRSAAIFSEVYGSPAVRMLSRVTRPFLLDPPEGFSEHPLLRTCGVLFIARHDQLDRLEAFAREPGVGEVTRKLTPDEACSRLPILKRDYVAGALLEPAAAEIDVHALHHGFLKQARANGVEIITDAEVTGLERRPAAWQIQTANGPLTAKTVVNAAGGWADELARLAGVAPIGVEPRRRTIVVVDAPEGIDPEAWPMTVDIDEDFYLKSEAGRILLSPADESPMMPCDCQADEYDVALAIHRIETATRLEVRKVHSKWAGLRSFAPDRNPVIGYDPLSPGFFWLAGQGGYGIQTAAGIASLAAALLEGRPTPAALTELGLDPAGLSPDRFRAKPPQQPA